MTTKEIKAEIESLSNIQILVQSYEEIAAFYMRRTRSNVLQKREFLEGLSVIFHQVKLSYKSELKKLVHEKKLKPHTTTLRKHNGKTILVLVSANTGLYGDIVKRTFNLFMEEVKTRSTSSGQADIAIIGRLGNQLFQFENIQRPYTYFDFPDNKVDSLLLARIVGFLLGYEEIYAFYGKFQTVVNQIPTKSSITGDDESQHQGEATKSIVGTTDANVKYIFEPSLENILTFFESEILASIFEQALYESQLAKFASRMITLDAAAENIKNSLDKTNFTQQKQRHRLQNTKQLNNLASYALRTK